MSRIRRNLTTSPFHVLGVVAAGLLLSSAACGQHQSDAFQEELRLQGGFEDLLTQWRVDDGNTVSLLWDFPTDQREDIRPSIEVPQPGEHLWYFGSRADILHPDATWTAGGGWQLDAQGQDVPLMSAEDSNPDAPRAKKDFYVAYWWKKAVSVTIDEPGLGQVSEGEPEGWASRLYPGWMFTIRYYKSGPPCPKKVKATVKGANGAAEIKAVVVHGQCQE